LKTGYETTVMQVRQIGELAKKHSYAYISNKLKMSRITVKKYNDAYLKFSSKPDYHPYAFNKAANRIFNIDKANDKVDFQHCLVQAMLKGHRCKIEKNGDTVSIFVGFDQRNVTDKFVQQTNELKKIKHDFVLDGVMSFHSDDAPIHKSDLTNYLYKSDTTDFDYKARIFMHDALSFDHEDMTDYTLLDRLDVLDKISDTDSIKILNNSNLKGTITDGRGLNKAIKAVSLYHGSEGAIIKDLDSAYSKTDSLNTSWKSYYRDNVWDAIVVEKKKHKGRFEYSLGINLDKKEVEKVDQKSTLSIKDKLHYVLKCTFIHKTDFKVGHVLRMSGDFYKEDNNYTTVLEPILVEKKANNHPASTLYTIDRIARLHKSYVKKGTDNNGKFVIKGNLENIGILENSMFIKAADGKIIIAGYASTDKIDIDGDKFTLVALKNALTDFVKSGFANVNVDHSNITVGKVIPSYKAADGKRYNTVVDEHGMHVVCELRSDIKMANDLVDAITKGEYRSFSIGGQALRSTDPFEENGQTRRDISRLDLHEVTICQEGRNSEAGFKVVAS